MEIMHRNGLPNSIIINLQFLLASLYRLKHLKQSMHCKFLPELLVEDTEWYTFI